MGLQLRSMTRWRFSEGRLASAFLLVPFSPATAKWATSFRDLRDVSLRAQRQPLRHIARNDRAGNYQQRAMFHFCVDTHRVLVGSPMDAVCFFGRA